ncbi:phosphopantetheine-binding protein [Neisseria sp. ZJ106]|uniref:Phosphopantetheine-binding protein n=1 Tax=Neisseria lisongii TaxID=2912188 RepID=A0AAW5AGM6_9NEIS|nr:phosphopantetheine-binding protein [Neisseria lisongii]MCF7521108.1 phosphopantetheine-binding protein [Neisseria lisongii]MCF7529242.1 phosphopantetheine-binding protein [Neisseria lisongii]WCL72033.1 phosphopantetheine-binding protein [Neisseria lisongii]
MEELKLELKKLIINSLDLEDLSPEDIADEAPLFGDDGLGLDSVDALELGLAVQKHFGFQMDKENQELREHFANVATLAGFIQKIKG